MAIFNTNKPPTPAAANVPYAATVDAVNNNTSPTQVDGLQLDSANTDPFWFRPDIEPLNWNKNFPYQLMVVKIDKDGNPIPNNNWSYTLPVPPKSLNINMPFASNVYATQGGIVEEHNGAPFRNISITGTTGILPLRGNAGGASSLSPAQSIFAGTIRTANRFSNIANTVGISKINNIVTSNEISTSDIGHGTGYYQFHVLGQFLERYATLKKSKVGKDYRLALMMWKDQHFYFVTPESFNLSRDSSSPFEYQYSLNFKAWKRVKHFGNSPTEYNYVPPVRNQGLMGQVLETLKEAREAIAVTADTIRAVGYDVDNAVLEPIRQGTLLCKDLLNIPQSLADVPAELIRGAAGAVVLWISTQNDYSAFNKSGPNGVGVYNQEWENLVATAKEVAEQGRSVLAGDYNTTTNGNRFINTVTDRLYNQDNTQAQLNNYAANSANRIFNNPNNYLSFFDSIPVGSLQTSKGWQNQYKNSLNELRQNSTRIFWETQTQKIQDVLNNFEALIGLSSPLIPNTYGTASIQPIRAATTEDFDIIFSLNKAIQSMSQLAISEDINSFRVDPISYIAGLANQSGIAFTEPTSKFLVPFPYGFTLEQLSLQYLGDPNRWMEIASLNGLQTPYVDEVGFSIPFISNGNGNSFFVSDITNLFVGQSIYLISNTQNQSNRIIKKIKKINDTYFMITVDGDSNLNAYLTSDNAIVHAFLPNTVNSQMSLYIPSTEQPQYEDFIYKPIPNVDDLNQIFKIANIDLLLDANNDIILTSDGDTPLAVGLNAIIQDLKIKVSTITGSIIQHPSFGIPIDIGSSIADTSALDIQKAIANTFKGDTTYTNVSTATVNINGPMASITFTVGLRGLADIVPVTINFN